MLISNEWTQIFDLLLGSLNTALKELEETLSRPEFVDYLNFLVKPTGVKEYLDENNLGKQATELGKILGKKHAGKPIQDDWHKFAGFRQGAYSDKCLSGKTVVTVRSFAGAEALYAVYMYQRFKPLLWYRHTWTMRYNLLRLIDGFLPDSMLRYTAGVEHKFFFVDGAHISEKWLPKYHVPRLDTSTPAYVKLEGLHRAVIKKHIERMEKNPLFVHTSATGDRFVTPAVREAFDILEEVSTHTCLFISILKLQYRKFSVICSSPGLWS